MVFKKGNRFSVGLTNNGRPPKFESAEKLKEKAIEYFEYCEGEYDEDSKEWIRHPERPTMTGIALFLGFASRQSMYDYGKKEPNDENDYSYLIKRIRMMIENKYEDMLGSKNATGAIFALKNMGWVDKQEIEQTTTQRRTEEFFDEEDNE